MSDNHYTKMFKYMQKGFANVDKSFEVVDQRFDEVNPLLMVMRRKLIPTHKK